MSFYQNIQPFIDYIFSIRKLKDYLSFDLLFPTKWSLPKNIPEGVEIVPFQSEENIYKGTSFLVQITEDNIAKVILVISKTIKLNKERELKEVLFKQTIDHLKKTFEQNDLDKLQNLYFDFATEHEDTSNLDAYDTGQPEDIDLAE